MQDLSADLRLNLPLVRRVVRLVARRYRLSRDDQAELTSAVFLKVVSDDYAVLRRFRGRSNLHAYLRTVVTRVLLDWRNARWGKWRPSAEARRIGPAAVTMERLVERDGLTAHEAVAMVAHEPRWGLSSSSAHRLWARLPLRLPRPQVVEVSDVATPHASDFADCQVEQCDVATRVANARGALRGVLAGLSADDRRLLMLRFGAGQSIAEIARVTGAEPRVLYRRLHVLLGSIGRRLEERQLTRADVLDLVGHRAAAIDHVLDESAVSCTVN